MEGRPFALLVVSALLALVVAWSYIQYRSSGGRTLSPLWLAFACTAAAVLFVGAGISGYSLSKHQRFVDGTAWQDSVIWPEIWMGIALLLGAIVLWRRGLRTL